MTDPDSLAELRAEVDDLFAQASRLPPGETLRFRADRIVNICDLFTKVMDDAQEHAAQNRAMRTTIEVGDKIIARLSGINPKEPIL